MVISINGSRALAPFGHDTTRPGILKRGTLVVSCNRDDASSG